MRWVDRLLQRWRIRMAIPWVPDGTRLLDIGCHQGELLQTLGARIHDSVGIDPLAGPIQTDRYRLDRAAFSEPMPFPPASFDVICLLATLEHLVDKEPLVRECRRLLRPLGRVVLTVPEPAVDAILPILIALRVARGMSLEEHHGFQASAAIELFTAQGFRRLLWRRFQLGLNHLLVFESPAG